MNRNKFAVFLLVAGVFFVTSNAHAMSFGFSDSDFRGGASWGTLSVTVNDTNSDTLNFSFEASAGNPAGSQVTGFAFGFDHNPDSVIDEPDTAWRNYAKPMNTLPGLANADEFLSLPPFTFAVTGKPNGKGFTPPGILPGETDSFSLIFENATFSDTTLDDFINIAAIRLQSLPNEINGGSLFLAGGPPDGEFAPVPEPATMLLVGTGLIGLAGFGRKKLLKKKKDKRA